MKTIFNQAVKLLFTILLLIGLSGCATSVAPPLTPEPMPDELKGTCDVTPPPDRKLYKSAAIEARLDMMETLASKLLSDLGACNVRLGAIESWDRRRTQQKEQ